MRATSRAGTVNTHPPGAPEFTSVFSMVCAAQSLVFYAMFHRQLFAFLSFFILQLCSFYLRLSIYIFKVSHNNIFHFYWWGTMNTKRKTLTFSNLDVYHIRLYLQYLLMIEKLQITNIKTPNRGNGTINLNPYEKDIKSQNIEISNNMN